eukprot:5696199-Prymnesium_polylepis.1
MLLASNMADRDRSWTCELRIACGGGSGGLCGRRPSRPATARPLVTLQQERRKVVAWTEKLPNCRVSP